MMTVAIIQARMGSSRLPGKVLMDLGGRTVLAHVVERCRAIETADVVCCAIPESAVNDPLAAEAERTGAVVFRGSEADVLERYYLAAKQLNADVVLRVTADCPLLDPAVSAAVLALRASEGADYACNNMPPSWPHGLDCEAFTFDWLDRAAREATDPFEREHVTPLIRRHPDARRVSLQGPGGDLSAHRWTLDYPEDMEFLRALFNVLAPEPEIPGYEKILEALAAHPEISAINDIHKIAHGEPEAIPSTIPAPSARRPANSLARDEDP